MLYIKFNFIFVFLFLITNNTFAFTGKECLNSVFKTKVSHKGSPMGLTDTILEVDKNLCVFTVNYEKLKFVKKKWVVDVCRGPIHIKYGTGAVEVFKRTASLCQKGGEDKYCASLNTLVNIVQDDGLIFAEGEKEDLDTGHGKFFCAYQLFNAYLKNGHVFSRVDQNKKNLNIVSSDSEERQVKEVIKENIISQDKKLKEVKTSEELSDSSERKKGQF